MHGRKGELIKRWKKEIVEHIFQINSLHTLIGVSKKKKKKKKEILD